VRDVLPSGGIAAELGVYKGDFSRELLDLAKPERLHLVDLWYLFGREWHFGRRSDRSTVGALKQVLDRCADELVSGRVRLHIGDDLVILETFPDRYFDWVYVDSVHAYEHTRLELEILTRKVKKGGLITGDDWIEDPAHPHHGVCRAVREFVAAAPAELVYAGAEDLQWALRNPGPLSAAPARPPTERP
jgi:hypothetical protein